MAAISETLRQARLRSGIDLDRLADKTKINPRYLQAIEAGDFDKLPSGIFARMFIKQYADAIGLDGASFADEFQRSMAFGNDSGARIHSIPSTRHDYHPTVSGLSSVDDRARSDRIASMLSSLIWVVAAILVCAGAYYALAHLPSRSTAVAGAAAPKPADHPASAGSTPAAAIPVPSTPPSAQAKDAASAAGSPPPSSAPIQLGITASDTVWVTARADGKTVLSEMLSPGSTKTVVATESAQITLGNAGGADITFNGKKLEPAGLKGQVRTLDFTPQGPQVISRTSPKAEPPPNPDPLLR